MSRFAAYFSLVLIVSALLAADVLILTVGTDIARLARVELDNTFGDDLDYESLTASLDKVLHLQGLRFRKILTADRADIHLTGRSVERVVLHEPHLILAESLETGGDLPDPADLPRIQCHNGIVELRFPEVFQDPILFRIDSLDIARLTDETYALHGELRHNELGHWTITGEFDNSPRLTCASGSMRLGPTLRAHFSPMLRREWDMWSPSGQARLSVRIDGEEVTATLAPSDAGVAYAGFPYRVDHVRGEIEFTAAGFTIKHLSGDRTRASGSGSYTDFTIRVDADDVPIDSKLREAFLGKKRTLFDALKPSGAGDLQLEVNVTPSETTLEIDMDVSNGIMDIPVRFSEINGRVSLSVTPDEMKGRIDFARAKVTGKSVSDLTANLLSSGSSLTFSHITAMAYGGVVSGEFVLDLDSGKYGGRFTGDRLDLREFTRETRSYRDKTIAGKISLSLEDLAGHGRDPDTLTGKGSLSIRDGFLWDVPIFFSMWTLNPQQVFRRRNQFDAGNITFDIRDRKFGLHGIAFTSRDVSLIGHGTLDFDGDLDVILRAQTGSLLGVKIPGLDKLLSPLEMLRGAFLGVQVRGTFENPETRLKMFPGLHQNR